MLQVSRPDESVFYTHPTVSPSPTCRLDTTEISLTLRSARQYGRVAEWSIAAVLKTVLSPLRYAFTEVRIRTVTNGAEGNASNICQYNVNGIGSHFCPSPTTTGGAGVSLACGLSLIINQPAP